MGRIVVSDRVRVDSRDARTFQLRPELVLSRVLHNGITVESVRQGDDWHLPEFEPGPVDLLIEYQGVLPLRLRAATALGPAVPVIAQEGSFLPAGSAWLPEFSDGLTSYHLRVRALGEQRAVATGRMLSERIGAGDYEAEFEGSGTLAGPSLFAGPWQVRQRTVNGVRLRTWFDSASAGLSDRYLDAAAGYVSHYSKLIGTYPYQDYHMLSAPFPVGLGFPGVAYLSQRILAHPYMSSRSLAHEVLHNWWGNGVFVDYRHGNWSEGLTTYMADHALAEQQGEARAMRLDWLRDYAALPAARERALTEFSARHHDAERVIGYGKSAFLFHMLRQQLGDEDFYAGLRYFWRVHRNEQASWRDLQRSFETVNGSDLTEFFQQWVVRRGAPRLFLTEAEFDAGQSHGTGVRFALEQENPVYALQVPLRLTTAAGEEGRTVRLDQHSLVTTLKADAPVTELEVDPDLNLFRLLSPGESPLVLRDVILRDDVGCVLELGTEEALEAARSLAHGLMDAPVSCTNYIAASAEYGPLLLIAGEERLTTVLEAMSLGPVPELIAGDADARVWTLHRGSGEPALVVSAVDAAALKALSGPLPHYGRRSYIRFNGGKATVQGIWPAGPSPLKVEFAVP